LFSKFQKFSAFLLEHFDPEDLERLQSALSHIMESRDSIEVGDKEFMVGHYVQAVDDFGPIAADSFGIICSVTPELRGLFLLDGAHLMESPFAPANVRVIFGTYVN